MKGIIEGKNIYLRPGTAADTENILRWRNAPHVMEQFLIREPLTKDTHLRWLKEEIGSGRAQQFIIVLKESGREIGSQYFHHIDKARSIGEFGIFIGEEAALGQGCGSEVLALSLEYAHNTMGLNTVFLHVLAGNSRAIKAYETAGFKHMPEKDEDRMIEGKTEKILYMEHKK